ncbi:MAG: hypothetical protein M3Z29_07100, partial [Pseudomonadota bacterium]|nr:hypothetical protein [Pseudomonadota bacterium]
VVASVESAARPAAPSALAPRGGVPGGAQGNAEVPVRPSAFPSRDAVLAQAQNQARAQMEMQRRGNPAIASPGAGPSQTATPRPSQAGTDAAYPWAVAGKTPPSVVAVAPAATPPAAPPRSGTTAPASAVSAGTAVVPPPPRSAVPAPGSSTQVPAPAAASAPSVSPAPVPEATAEQPDFNARANDLMVNHVPRLAQRAERVVSRVLFAASRAEDVVGDGEVLETAAAIGRPAADAVTAMPVSARDAQQFNDAARVEYSRRGATPQALMLQVRAFGANPQDPDVVGNLAFLLLRQQPAQADAARRLALYALTLHGSRYPQGRVEDWATLAIASALSGRERDAKNALLVSLAVAPNLDRQCRAAMDTYTIYGERMRAPVEAMLYSAHASRRATQASACEWPPRWTLTSGR